MPKKEDDKLRYSLNSTILAVLYFVFYTLGSYFFFNKTNILAGIFGALVFWLVYFFIQVISIKSKNMKIKKKKKIILELCK